MTPVPKRPGDVIASVKGAHGRVSDDGRTVRLDDVSRYAGHRIRHMSFDVERSKGPTRDELREMCARKTPVCPDCGQQMRKSTFKECEPPCLVIWTCGCEPEAEEVEEL